MQQTKNALAYYKAICFDRIIGPEIGIDDFILGGLSDFPLNNLLVNTAPGRLLFPYLYSNRAAAITYEPERFSQMLKLELAQRANKPLFLAVHFCISHWPFTWAQGKFSDTFSQSDQYSRSIEEVDRQLGDFMTFLTQSQLLKNSIVILLSDHGTTLGMKNDRAVSKKMYRGEPQKIKLLTVFQYDNKAKKSAHTDDYVIDTSYGQGTDVLSLYQNQVLLAIKRYGVPFVAHHVNHRVALLDLAPTLLDLLKLPALKKSDGVSLSSFLLTKNVNAVQKPFFIESGHSFNEIETNDIL